MISFDTNFLLRHILGDDQAHSIIATTLYQQCCSNNQKIYFNIAVILETVWTLQRFLPGPSTKIDFVNILQGILSDETFFIESKRVLSKALTEYAVGRADLSDYESIIPLKKLSAMPVYLFDKKFQDLDGVISQSLA